MNNCISPHNKLLIDQQLRSGDYAQRLNIVRQMETIFEANDYVILLMSDEPHFHIKGRVNQQKCRYWAFEYQSE